MKQSAPYAVIGLGVLIMGVIAWWFGFREAPVVEEPAPSAPEILITEGLSIYTNGTHGFLLAYPEGAEVDEAEDPLLAITTYRVKNEQVYPREYETSVQVSRSEESGDVRSCLSVRDDAGEEALPDRVIGGVTFKAFSYGDAAMMRYESGVRYRTMYEEACWTLAARRAGSSYREEPNLADLSEEMLTAEYTKLEQVIESFRFAR